MGVLGCHWLRQKYWPRSYLYYIVVHWWTSTKVQIIVNSSIYFNRTSLGDLRDLYLIFFNIDKVQTAFSFRDLQRRKSLKECKILAPKNLLHANLIFGTAQYSNKNTTNQHFYPVLLMKSLYIAIKHVPLNSCIKNEGKLLRRLVTVFSPLTNECYLCWSSDKWMLPLLIKWCYIIGITPMSLVNQ